MTIKIRKIFTNYEKEEKWLNKMAAKGLHLKKCTFCTYHFEEGTPGEYCYRIELLDQLPDQEESKEYIEFMEENKVELVDTYFRWVYFRKKTADGAFEIYSDSASRIIHYRRIANLFGILAGVNLLIALVNLNLSSFNVYISSLNWMVVILLAPIYFMYVRNIKTLEKELEIHHK
jgi:hypothetical protein